MAGVWSEQRKLERWLEVELAALDAWAEIGACPPRRRRRSGTPQSHRRRSACARSRSERTTTSRRSSTPSRRGSASTGRWFHYGLTSSDVLDTALSLQIQEAGALLARRHRPRLHRGRRPGGGAPADADDRPDARRARRADDVRAEARGLGVRARPRPRRASSARSSGLRVGKLSGAVGTYSATDPESSESRASGSGSSLRRPRHRSSSATAMRSC